MVFHQFLGREDFIFEFCIDLHRFCIEFVLNLQALLRDAAIWEHKYLEIKICSLKQMTNIRLV